MTVSQAQAIVDLRPFASYEELHTKLGQGRKKNGPGGVSSRMIEDTDRLMVGYAGVDGALAGCERIGKNLREIIDSWINVDGDPAAASSKLGDGGVTLTKLSSLKEDKVDGYVSTQPNMGEGVQLKEYQLLGLNWLNLLHSKGHSCILADEMGKLWIHVSPIL